MQRIGNLFQKLIDYDNLLIAFRKAKKGTKTIEAIKFEFNLENELLSLKEELITEKYTPKKYRYFMLKGLKEREISIASFRDRVVHHSLVNILEPIFEKVFIYDSYANRKNKGLLKAIKKVQSSIKTNTEYFLKCDIKKFFDNINYLILENLVQRKIKDKRLLNLISVIIRNDIDKNKGLPIGNLTSQFFANVYLNNFDHFLKENLKIKKYIRYMDDFVIIDESLENIKNIKFEIEKYLEKNLKLTLKKEATYINKADNGISFCGVRIYKNLIRIKRESLNLSYQKLKIKVKEYRNKKISEEELYKTLNSIFSYWRKYSTKELRKKIIENLKIV